jgi:hypothetical protein
MNTQLNIHAIQETATVPFAPPILPVVIEQTARHVFESFSEKMKAALNGREDRALKLAVEGHVTHKSERIFSVRSEDSQHSYLVNLDKGFCTCPDSQKGHVCKHRLAAYLVEQSMKASQQMADSLPTEPATPPQTLTEPDPTPEPDPQEEMVEKVRAVFNSRSQFLRQAIIYAVLYHDNQPLPVEIVDLQGTLALVRALPKIVDGKLIPQFPFPGNQGNQAAIEVIAKSLTTVKIYR